MMEEWRPVAGFEGLYEISDLGRVASLRRRKRIIRRLHIDVCGYLRITIKIGDRTVNRRIHTLVAEAFIGPRPDGKVVRHLDGDPLNLRPSNLRYGTVAENAQDMLRHGRNRNARKMACQRAGHPYDERNLRTNPDGTRHCRSCHAKAERGRRLRRKTEGASQ